MKICFAYSIIYFASFFFVENINAQNAGITTKNVDINISAGTSLIIPGDVKIIGGTDYFLNNGNCYIAGNFTNGGNSFSTSGNGTEIFNGNSTIGGTINSIFNNFVINPSALVALLKGIDIKNDWTNNGKFIPNTSQVSFSGTVVPQNIYGSGTFFDLVIQNNTNFLASRDTIKDQFSNSATINGGTSLIVFDSVAKIIGGYSKFFYDMEILNGANTTHTSGGGDIHIDNSFTNNGNYTEGASYTTYFDKVNAIENLSGTGTTTFGNVTIGKSGAIGFGTTLNANAHSFTVAGTTFTFNHNNSVFNGGTGTVTFNGTTDLIGKATGVINTTPSFYGVTVLNATTLGIDATVNGQLSITNPTNTFVINGNTLTLNGTVNSSGTLTGSSTSNITVGSAGVLGTLYFDQTTDNITNVLKNFAINSGIVSLGNSLNITAGTSAGSYGTTSGTVTANGSLITGGYLTLKSNQYGDAQVGNSSGSISGNATVERYIPAKRAWRFLAVPFVKNSTTQTINQAWQDTLVNSSLAINFNKHPGYGTHITYTPDPTFGYDVNTTNNPSIKVWDVNTNDWSTIIPHTIGVPITTYPAYCLFVRGSRAVNLSLANSAPADATTLRITGNLNVGTVTPSYTTVAGNGVLVSNPYASPIDILKVLSANNSNFVDKQFAIWDPGINGLYNVGAYRYYSNSYTAPDPGSYTGGTYAQSGQAFILTAKNSSGLNINFTENNKVPTGEAAVFSRIIKERESHPAIYVNLMSGSKDSLTLADGVTAGFGNQFSAKVDEADAQKLSNADEDMMLVRGNANLAIELRPIPVLTDTLFYRLYLAQKPYTLQIFGKDLDAMAGQAWLVDKYLNTKTQVILNDTTLYNFTPDVNDLATYRDRFMVVFKRTYKATPVATTMSSGGAEAATLKGTVTVYPNPVIKGGKALLLFKNMKAGKYEVILSSLEGKDLSRKVIQHKDGDDNYSLQLDARWATGNYIIRVNGKNNYTATTKLIIGK